MTAPIVWDSLILTTTRQHLTLYGVATVHAKDIAPLLNRHERTVRRHMARLEQAGLLKRYGQRRGYTVH